jgi:hypothetical protein
MIVSMIVDQVNLSPEIIWSQIWCLVSRAMDGSAPYPNFLYGCRKVKRISVQATGVSWSRSCRGDGDVAQVGPSRLKAEARALGSLPALKIRLPRRHGDGDAANQDNGGP